MEEDAGALDWVGAVIGVGAVVWVGAVVGVGAIVVGVGAVGRGRGCGRRCPRMGCGWIHRGFGRGIWGRVCGGSGLGGVGVGVLGVGGVVGLDPGLCGGWLDEVFEGHGGCQVCVGGTCLG